MSQCPRKQFGSTGGNLTVRERASTSSVSNTRSVRRRDTLPTGRVSACVVPKVSHSSQKWDSVVGHFIVVFITFNPSCPAVPRFIENIFICPIGTIGTRSCVPVVDSASVSSLIVKDLKERFPAKSQRRKE